MGEKCYIFLKIRILQILWMVKTVPFSMYSLRFTKSNSLQWVCLTLSCFKFLFSCRQWPSAEVIRRSTLIHPWTWQPWLLMFKLDTISRTTSPHMGEFLLVIMDGNREIKGYSLLRIKVVDPYHGFITLNVWPKTHTSITPCPILLSL